MKAILKFWVFSTLVFTAWAGQTPNKKVTVTLLRWPYT